MNDGLTSALAVIALMAFFFGAAVYFMPDAMRKLSIRLAARADALEQCRTVYKRVYQERMEVYGRSKPGETGHVDQAGEEAVRHAVKYESALD